MSVPCLGSIGNHGLIRTKLCYKVKIYIIVICVDYYSNHLSININNKLFYLKLILAAGFGSLVQLSMVDLLSFFVNCILPIVCKSNPQQNIYQYKH